MKKKSDKIMDLSTSQVIAFGFLVAIVIGTVLLSLPISSVSGEWTSVIDSLFMATSSVCVTGLVVENTGLYWSFFGQIVILILIQFGGLGIVTLSTAMMLLLGKKVTLKDRLLIQESYNLNNLSGMVKLTKHILSGTIIVEAIGAICYSFVYIPEYGPLRGTWYSVFNSISAFCNAGMDILGGDSLGKYCTNPWINFTTMILIILGGLGFIVWWDILDVLKQVKNEKINIKKIFEKLELHSKLVLVTTAILLFIGFITVFICEYNNPETIGDMNLFNKIMASAFQSVTLRTAGFTTISQASLRDSTVVVCLMEMFIGGSPVGTAGGVKTVTVALIALGVYSVVKGKSDITIFKRKIPTNSLKKALAVFTISGLVLLFSTMVFSFVVSDHSFLDLFYETTSAVGTVGLSRNLTGNLNIPGKIIIIILMYLGRIGPITLAIAFNNKKSTKSLVIFAEEDVVVG